MTDRRSKVREVMTSRTLFSHLRPRLIAGRETRVLSKRFNEKSVFIRYMRFDLTFVHMIARFIKIF